MDGLLVMKKDNYLARINRSSASLGLLANIGDTDFMIYDIGVNNPTWIEPGEAGMVEFFYVLEGSLTLNDGENEIPLEQYDSFYCSDIKKTITAKTSTGTRLLYITSKPVFSYLYGYMGDLKDLLEKSEEKDMYTYNHGKRVMEYSVKLSEKMGLPSELADKISVSSVFHDIGKCYVPDGILNKPASLSREEYRYIMKHPIHGRDLVEGKFGSDIAEIVEQHHERVDGSGYPFGLTGDEIRLEAKIIAVADSYDAMTTDRPYRKGMPPAEAAKELKRCAGKMYDRKVVNSMLEILKDEHLI